MDTASGRTSAQLIDQFIFDMQSAGRLCGRNSESAYRRTLGLHAEDAEALLTADRLDVKRTLQRWPSPTSQRRNHSVLTSFYDWCCEEGLRSDNPARAVRKAKARPVSAYRPTRSEVERLLAAVETRRERRLIYLGVLTGARRAELMGFRGRHFAREGWVHFSPDITKGGKERWVPVLAELEPVVAEIRLLVGPDEFVLKPIRRPWLGLDYTTIGREVARVAKRAGITGHVSCHSMRHAFGSTAAKSAGPRVAQVLMGHASIQTTVDTYCERPDLDEIAVSVGAFRYGTPQVPVSA